jgi:hypothetical protein
VRQGYLFFVTISVLQITTKIGAIIRISRFMLILIKLCALLDIRVIWVIRIFRAMLIVSYSNYYGYLTDWGH